MDISQQIENDNYSLLNKNTIKELHQLCRENGIKNYSKLRKLELVELLQKLDKQFTSVLRNNLIIKLKYYMILIKVILNAKT